MSQSASRTPADLSLDAALIDEARELHIDLSQAAEAGIAAAVRRERARLWQEQNAAALESSNAYLERHGLPLRRFQQF
jgi:antitoxin CcdA